MHGPLMATLPMDLLRCHRPDARVQHVEFKAVWPTFDRQAFSIYGQPSSGGKTVHLWSRDQEPSLTMDATATLG